MKTSCTASLSLVYSTADYYVPLWCRSAHTRLIDSVLNNTLRMVTECLRSNPIELQPILLGILPAELCHPELSLGNRGNVEPYHILQSQLAGSPDMHQE